MNRPVEMGFADGAQDRCAVAAEVLMAGLLIFAPLALGAARAWSELVVVGFGVGLALCLALSLLGRNDSRFVWSWAYVPVALFLLVGVVQLVPLPAWIMEVLSPQTSELKNRLLADLPEAAGGLGSMSVTFYSWETLHNVRLLVAAASVFAVAVNVYRRPEQIRRLLWVVAAVGGVMAVLAIGQIISGTDRIYWSIPTGHNVARGGAFVNRNNFCLFMNMSIGATLALLFLKLGRGRSRGGAGASLSERLGEDGWFLAGVVVLGTAAVFLSLSRGGATALVGAAVVMAVVMGVRKTFRAGGWVLGILGLVAFVSLLYLGFDAVYDRLATLQEEDAYSHRWQIVKDLAVLWTRFPLLGTGLGSHEVVYPMFDRGTTAAVAGHAEDEYAQIMEETGVVGLVLALVFVAVLLRSFLRCVRSENRFAQAVAYGLGLGLVAVLIHSFSDFGLHMPANTCLAAAMAGMLVGLARRTAGRGGNGGEVVLDRRSLALRKVLAGVFLVLVIAVGGWALVTAEWSRVAENHWWQAMAAEQRVQEAQWVAENKDYVWLISQTASAARADPGKVLYSYWLAVYRWRAISRVRSPETGELIVSDRTLDFVERIVEDLNDVRRLCPTFGPAYCVAGQLEKFVLGRADGAKLIRRGYELAPNDPTACLVAGTLEASEGDEAVGRAQLVRAVVLAPAMYREVVAVCLDRLEKPEWAVEIAGEDPGRLMYVARALEDVEKHAALAERVRARTTEALRERCTDPKAPAPMQATLAGYCWREKDYEGAVRHYQWALAARYGQVGWRIGLARALRGLGRLDEAIHELRIVRRLQPQNEVSKRLLKEWDGELNSPGTSG